MKTAAVLLPLLFALGDSRSVFKRNAYGDEAVTPAPAAPAVAVAAPEQSVQQLPAEPAAAQEAPVQQSGYRAKRGAQNGYGDEPVAPKPGYPQDAPVAAPEQTVQQLPAEPAPAQEAPVQQSGYRAKREAQNSYGDEPVTEAPKPAGYVAEAPAEAPAAPAPEQAVEQVPAESAVHEAPVEHSGYRAKRGAQNGYGDEPVAPKPGYPQDSPVVAPEQSAQEVPSEPSTAQEAPVHQSGYRAKRGAQNGYGDEPVAPKAGYPQDAPIAAPEQTAQQVPSEPAPAQEAPVQQSGYRAKRDAQNGYGDEPVTEAPKPVEAETPAPEQAVEQVPAESAPAAPVEHSGY